MKRTLNAIALFVLATAGPLSASAYAADQFWVSLGSYAKLVFAEEKHQQASATFTELHIVPSETHIGSVYRVVAGPTAGKAGARATLEQARNAGFVDAWMLNYDGSQPMAGAAAADLFASDGGDDSKIPTYASDSYSTTYALEDSAAGDVLDGYSSDSDFGRPSSDDYDAVTIGSEELVEEAPEDYGLHRLERSMRTLPPGEAADSRLRELRADPDK